ncbi:MAG TPA: nuclear transport factor 2 family protein [Herpetosiphonaceae bacterium]
MTEINNRANVAAAFQGWMDGTSYISELLADDLQWEIVGNSLAAKQYTSKQQFVGEVLQPFGARFSARFRPTVIRGIYADGDTVIVLWDGEGTARDGQPYTNTYAWFLTLRDGLVVRAVAFFDSIAFNDLWSRVQPAE